MALPAHNLCANPAASVALTGWTGTASPFRVTGLTGAERTTGIQATANGYIRSAAGAVTPGQDYSVSFSGKLSGPGATGTLGTTYWVWYDSGMSDLSYPNWGSWPNSDTATWYRHSATATAPEGAAYLGVIQDVGTFGPVLTALLIEAGAVAHDYADGDTSGWAWDGTTGLSSSQPSGTFVTASVAAAAGTVGSAVTTLVAAPATSAATGAVLTSGVAASPVAVVSAAAGAAITAGSAAAVALSTAGAAGAIPQPLAGVSMVATTAAAYGTAQGGTADAGEGEPGPTIIALAQTAGMSGTALTTGQRLTLRPTAAAASGRSNTPFSSTLGVRRRLEAHAPAITVPALHAGEPALV